MAVMIRLTERDGELFCGGQSLGPVPELNRYGVMTVWHVDGDLALHQRRRDVLGGGNLFFYRCDHCNAWAAGTNRWCSDECHRAYLAAYARERRALRAKARPAVACAVCGSLIEAKRGTRHYCSDRCRQQAHRAAAPP